MDAVHAFFKLFDPLGVFIDFGGVVDDVSAIDVIDVDVGINGDEDAITVDPEQASPIAGLTGHFDGAFVITDGDGVAVDGGVTAFSGDGIGAHQGAIALGHHHAHAVFGFVDIQLIFFAKIGSCDFRVIGAKNDLITAAGGSAGTDGDGVFLGGFRETTDGDCIFTAGVGAIAVGEGSAAGGGGIHAGGDGAGAGCTGEGAEGCGSTAGGAGASTKGCGGEGFTAAGAAGTRVSADGGGARALGFSALAVASGFFSAADTEGGGVGIDALLGDTENAIAVGYYIGILALGGVAVAQARGLVTGVFCAESDASSSGGGGTGADGGGIGMGGLGTGTDGGGIGG